MVTFEVEFEQGALLVVQRRAYEPGPAAGVNTAEGSFTLLICAVLVDGPDVNDHVPVPTTGVLATMVAEPPSQINWAPPAAAPVGGATIVTEVVVSNAGQIPDAGMK